MLRAPSIEADGFGRDIYLVLDDFGARYGRAWRETGDRETVIQSLLAGEFSDPIRIIAFNIVEGWSRDVTVDIADEVRRRYSEMDDVPELGSAVHGGQPALKIFVTLGQTVQSLPTLVFFSNEPPAHVETALGPALRRRPGALFRSGRHDPRRNRDR